MEKTIKQDDPEQAKRFIDTAREIGVDETTEGAERAFTKAVPLRRGPQRQTVDHS